MQTMYDKIGVYNQDAVNGFDLNFLDEFLDSCGIKSGDKVLDAMAGDGNLSERILSRYADIELITTDISKTQCEIAKSKLEGKSKVMCLDFISENPFKEEFDLVIIKSGNHEIPYSKQKSLYQSVFQALKPGGRFINLGILLPTEELREDVNTLNIYRSKLAEVEVDIKNRHFLLKEEFYHFLKEVGFQNIKCSREFHYKIDMQTLAEQYFAGDEFKKTVMNGVVTGLHHFRDSNLTVLEKNWQVKMPGEISIAFKPYNQ